MLKTTTDQPGKPNRALMALGILQGYLKHPLWFLLTTMLSLPVLRCSFLRICPAVLSSSRRFRRGCTNA